MTRAEAANRRFAQHLPDEGKLSINMHRKSEQVNQNGDQLTNVSNGSGRYDRSVDEFDSSTRSASSRQTQEWLEEAKRIVALSPARGLQSPSRLVGSPRFGVTKQGRSSASNLDKRDPFSRSARRHRAAEGFSGEILARTANHTRNLPDANPDPPKGDLSPASDLQKWFSKIANHSPESTPPSSPPPLPPRQSLHRKSRFQAVSDAPASHHIPTSTNHPAFSPRNFKSPSNNGADAQLLSPPKNPESAHRRSPSSCSVAEDGILSPPHNLVESAHRRSISSSTCRTDRVPKKDNDSLDGELKDLNLNRFLKEQRTKIFKLMNGEINGRAKVVLSGPSNSTGSMAAAICYAWLLENRMRANGKKQAQNGNDLEIVVPVMNIRRGKMWKQRQGAWLFYHVGLDATSLLFSNEVELETLMMAKQLRVVEVGQDILKTNGEVRSACTVLTDNYCEDAYDLLQTPIVKKLLLAGILLDTQNLNASPKLSMTRDAEAVQLLMVASPPNYRNTLYDQLTHDQRDHDFFDVLTQVYGNPPSEIKWDKGESMGSRLSERIPSNEIIATNDDRKKVSPVSALGKPTASAATAPVKTPTKPNNDASRGKNKNFFAKLFGFGSK